MRLKIKKYKKLNLILKKKIEKKIKINSKITSFYIENIGRIFLYNYDFKTIELVDLLNVNESLAFNFYKSKKKEYKKVCDIGANIGIHSIILSKCNYEVVSYEPDPVHYSFLKKNIKLNKIKNFKTIKSAIYNTESSMKFVKVLEHSPKSHLRVEKKKVKSCGKKLYFYVKVKPLKKIIKNFDFIKIDAEGSEAKIILSLNKKENFTSDMLIEISNKKNAKDIYNHLKKLKIKFNNLSLFKPKIVKKVSDMPSSHLDGFLFINKIKKN